MLRSSAVNWFGHSLALALGCVVAAIGCGDYTSLDSSPSVSISASVTEGVAPIKVQLFSVVTGGDGALTYSWTFGDGSEHDSSGNPMHVFDVAGNYAVILTVVDEDGDSGQAFVNIEVAEDLAPSVTASAEPHTGPAPLLVNFSCDVSGGNAPVNAGWSFGQGGREEATETAFTYVQPGTFIATCTAQDAEGDTSSDSVAIVVSGPGDDTIPEATASAFPNEGSAPLSVNFYGNALGGNGPLAYSWDFGDGGVAAGANATHTYTAVGVYNAVLTVSDLDDDSDLANVIINVAGPDSQPSVSVAASPHNGQIPLTVQFECSVDGGDAPLEIQWAFGDGGISDHASALHTYSLAGNYTATCLVVDADGDSASGSALIVASPPGGSSDQIEATAIPSPYSGYAPLQVDFFGFAAGGTAPYTYEWNFGDGNNKVGQDVHHVYDTPGLYQAVLTVTDASLAVDINTHVIYVYAWLPDPEVDCSDGLDNDTDTYTDCEDINCDGAFGPGGAVCEYDLELSCSDGFDNDADADIDCADWDCIGVGSCESSNETKCRDAFDNDGDGDTDCADSDCSALAFCELGGEVTCDDGFDNDADAAIDCADGDCMAAGAPCEAGAEATCDDDLDNDGDGAPDCADPDCNGVVTASVHCEWGVELSCDDGLDNDADGLPDCPDLNCAMDPRCIPEADCANGDDDDGDGMVDCADPGCVLAPPCEWLDEATCDDSIDNDGDGYADCSDASCDAIAGCEFGAESTCDDGFDNDGDGAADCTDSDCGGVDACEFGVEATCDDGFDNDGDGDADCADADCSGLPVCEPEVDCFNGIDDDPGGADGDIDCADPGCRALPPCEVGEESICNDGVDNDGDGLTDCEEAVCSFSCNAPACGAGELAIGAFASDLPLQFGYDNAATSWLWVKRTGTIASTHVRFSATHPYVNYVTIRLISPAGTWVDLCVRRGESTTSDWDGTVFTDAAAVDIEDGMAPFAGAYRPDEPLGTISGEDALGWWGVDVSTWGYSGTIQEFSLALCLAGSWGCDATESPETTCDDAVDNDCDELIDCRDEDCDGTAGCEFGMESSCSDGFDNDGDGLVDCDDFSCGLTPPCDSEINCEDGLDTDGDGLVDCLDPGCDGLQHCEYAVERTCDDDFDNDGDGDLNCADSDCEGSDSCEVPVEQTCDDGFDNDGDGYPDCADADCDDVGVCEFPSETSCHDWSDNDGDGDPDCADSDCAGSAACGEICGNDIDDDMDGTIDCGDSECASQPSCEPDGESLCDDGIDNDGNGLADCAEPACTLVCDVPPCDTGQVAIGAVYEGLPVSIDYGNSLLWMGVHQQGRVRKATARFAATHTYDEELEISLRSPSGREVHLSLHHGGDGDDYDWTIFSADAAIPIVFGSPPFSGAYRPDGSLSSMLNEQIQGNWSIYVRDYGSRGEGQVLAAELALCVTQP